MTPNSSAGNEEVPTRRDRAPPKNAPARNRKSNRLVSRRRSLRRITMKLYLALAVAFCAFLPTSNALNAQTKPAKRGVVKLTEEALKIHREALLIDGHNDLPWQFRSKD